MKLVFAKKVFFSIQNIINHYFFSFMTFVKFFLQKKRLLLYLEHNFLFYFDREQIENKIAFFDQNKGKRLLKMLIKIYKYIFIAKGLLFYLKYYQERFFATKTIIKHYFLWYFQEEQTKKNSNSLTRTMGLRLCKNGIFQT